MQNVKLNRRLAGCTRNRLGEIDFSKVKDGRQGKVKWPLAQILKSVVVGIMAGQKGLGEIEESFSGISTFMRRVLGFHRCIPDTTMRDTLIKVGIDSLRRVLQQTIFLAIRRKALGAQGLPFHIVALDGKKTCTRIQDGGRFAQTISDYEGETPKYSVATITACLISSLAKVCLDAIPMPAETNEKGFFQAVLHSLLNTYGDLFKMVTYDAGANSKANALFVHLKGLFYVFALKKDQPTLFKRATKLLAHLGPELANAETDEILSGKRIIRRIWATTGMRGFHRWSHLQVVLRVECLTLNPKTGTVISCYSRYFLSNAPLGTLSSAQWLLLIRSHWAVENNCHNIFDKIFQEDKRPYILDPKGMIVVMLLRRIAYNLLSLFRSVTQRSKKKRKMPWKSLMRSVLSMLMTLEERHLPPGTRLEKCFNIV
jgi:hypothetical protein